MKNTVVVDTSVVMKWVIDEPDSSIAVALYMKWFNEGMRILAPALLAYEVANVLHQKVQKGSITVEEAEWTLMYLLEDALEPEFSQNAALGIRAMQLARLYSLPATYDPHYLALAEREQCDYWTADTHLWNAIGGKLPWVRRLADYKNALH
ncbi:MAG TPA: type II toxin-antitoxin system VapC family toxin [Ktedonobacteraceae bacterium]|nr:type II toxin-antitoxin system VapC family toxin [Ktedonobacteraceae bacterium]